ncbi:nectin-3-like protein [Ictalurus furcatus]|uniref:nectin-3-like protein n=1 Tax=Ictalurus furcatus TaxID=66913 RepID=UPI002350BF64|nr:nectin-3-like protein [Ictalurus furcatus]
MARGLRFLAGNIAVSLQFSIHLPLLLFVFIGGFSNEVVVPENVQVVLGRNATLSCRVDVGANLSLTQSSWERSLPMGSVTVAVFNPQFGISVSEEYVNRVHFLNPSVEDASIVLEGVGFADIGSYICKVVTFPLGNSQASTVVDIMVEPKVYVLAGPDPLVDGNEEGVVATCMAEKARPPADVFWEAELYGRSEQILQDEPDGTTSTKVDYIWAPTSHALNHALTCVVRHPTLAIDLRIPYVLNIQFAPDVMVIGQNDVWYVGQENAKLDCRANANPPPHHFFWTRLNMQMPAGVKMTNSSLVFTRPLQTNDSGTYRCEVQNEVGLHSQEVHIWIHEPPSMPSVPTPTSGGISGLYSSSPSHVRARFTSPTLASLHDGTMGTVVGGAIGGTLVLVLLLGIALLWYIRQQRTFHGDYYTKQYVGASYMQKESLELHDTFPDDSANSSQDLKHNPDGDGDTQVYHSYRKNKGLWDSYCPGDSNISTIGENSTPYLQEKRYDMATDCDYVSHKDGSVISRREWYV